MKPMTLEDRIDSSLWAIIDLYRNGSSAVWVEPTPNWSLSWTVREWYDGDYEDNSESHTGTTSQELIEVIGLARAMSTGKNIMAFYLTISPEMANEVVAKLESLAEEAPE